MGESGSRQGRNGRDGPAAKPKRQEVDVRL